MESGCTPSCQQRVDHGWSKTSAPGSYWEDSPPSNGRIQHPWDVCGTENQSPIVVIPHPCGERETQTWIQNTWKDQSEPAGRTSGALCSELEPSLCHLWWGPNQLGLPASGRMERWWAKA